MAIEHILNGAKAFAEQAINSETAQYIGRSFVVIKATAGEYYATSSVIIKANAGEFIGKSVLFVQANPIAVVATVVLIATLIIGYKCYKSHQALKQKLADKEREVTNLSSNSKGTEEELEETQKKVDSLKKDLQKAKEDSETCKKETQQAKTLLETQYLAAQKEAKLNTELRTQLTNLQTKLETQQQEIHGLTKRLTDASADVKRLTKQLENSKLDSSNNSLSNQSNIEKLKQDLISKTEEVLTITESLKMKELKLMLVEKQLQEFNSKNIDLNKENEQLKSINEQLQNEKNKASTARALPTPNNTINELESLQKKLKELSDKYTSSTTDLDASKSKNKQLKSDIERLEEAINQSNISLRSISTNNTNNTNNDDQQKVPVNPVRRGPPKGGPKKSIEKPIDLNKPNRTNNVTSEPKKIIPEINRANSVSATDLQDRQKTLKKIEQITKPPLPNNLLANLKSGQKNLKKIVESDKKDSNKNNEAELRRTNSEAIALENANKRIKAEMLAEGKVIEEKNVNIPIPLNLKKLADNDLLKALNNHRRALGGEDDQNHSEEDWD